jgi:hypothetical protein
LLCCICLKTYFNYKIDPFFISFSYHINYMLTYACLAAAALGGAGVGASVLDRSRPLNARAYQAAGDYPTASDYPEESLPGVKSRPSAAIAFTGGGSRSYLASVGYLAGLHELGLIPGIRYMSGISGGSWATLAFSFSQLDVSDSVLLGAVAAPAAITREGLQHMDAQCLRYAVSVDFVKICLEALKNGEVESLADSWAYATQKAYFEPYGIAAGVPFSWDAASVADIKARNPSLKDVDFMLPSNSDRPFPFVGTAMVGPSESGGYAWDDRNFTMLEISPLTVGQMRTMDVGYDYHSRIERKHYRTVGGAVETFAYARYGSAPLVGLGEDGDAQGDLRVPVPDSFMDIQFAGAASSYAIGAFVESFPHLDKLTDSLGLHIDYWSPVDKHPTSKDTFFADGGSYMNIMLPSMLQRRVQKIVLCINENQPLLPASDWNPATDTPSSAQASDTLSSLFGVIPEDSMHWTWQKRSFDITKNQYFPTEDWVPVATALQAAQAEGNGIIHTVNLTTVDNSWWGIPAGFTTQVTFVYLGRLANWEAELSDEMRELLVPSDPEDAANLSVDVKSGPFRSFPHYFTAGGLEDHERANVLSDLTGWSITNNAELFKSIFS